MVETLEIQLEGIVKGYDRTILDGVSLKVSNESYVAIVGKSGAGKSTLMNILGLIESFDDGYYRFQDTVIRPGRDYSAIRRDNIGFIFQSYHLIPTLSCRENILLPQLYSRKEISKFDDLVERLGIGELLDKQVVYLSGGEKQRVAIARALLLNPALIIADEPTGNLDRFNTEEVLKLLEIENNNGRAVIMITHDDEVAQRAKNIYRLEKGKLYENN